MYHLRMLKRLLLAAVCTVAIALLIAGAVRGQWAGAPSNTQRPEAARIPPTELPSLPAEANEEADSTPVAPSPLPQPTPSPLAEPTPSAAPRPSITEKPQPSPSTSGEQVSSIELVGALQLRPFSGGVHGDVAAYKNLAFVGKWRGPCPGTGVDIIDISNPSAPIKIADTNDYPDTSMEDMQALEIGALDVLAIGLQDCGNNPAQGVKGLELVDITDPKNPRRLSLFSTGTHGVHELDVTRTPAGRSLALLAVPDMEAATAGADGRDGTGDLLIVDISDPANPFQVGEWGVLDEPQLGRSAYDEAPQGGDARTQLHSARANEHGTLAYLSYWDAGVIMLDISDPVHPTYLGRTTFTPEEEGNAHSVAEAQNGTLLLQADEDFSPFGSIITSTAFMEKRGATEASFTPPIAQLPGKQLGGEVVDVGRGCPAGWNGEGAAEDPYLADPAGKIALIERGSCRFDLKIARAQEARATGVLVYNNEGGADGLMSMGGDRAAPMPNGTPITITIPAVFVARDTGVALRDSGPPVDVQVRVEFNGWGYLRIFDIKDPAHPIRLGTFATPNTLDEAATSRGSWSIHNPEVRGATVFASWYSDGVRAIDISDPSRPREIANWTGDGAPKNAPPVHIWSVVPHGDLLLASDVNFGLYVLKMGTSALTP